jgi:uncharacterized protein (TIGR00369 family)
MSVDPKEALRAMEALSPFNRLLGIKGESADRGRVVLVLPVRGDFVGDPERPALHGGVLSSLIDTAGGAAAWSALATDESVSTVDLHVDYLEPAGLGAPLRAEAVLIRKGNRVCHVRISVTQAGMLVAEGRGVYNIHRKRRDGTEPPTTDDAGSGETGKPGRDE